MFHGKVKTSILGGASITWIPIFMKDLSASEGMVGGEVCLYDIDGEKLAIMAAFARKMLAEKGMDIAVTLANTLDEALIGADFVINTVLQGSHALWKDEMHIALRYGIEQPKGMSVGPGGLAMGLRQIRWAVQVAQRMEQLCPKAWFLNFSNPMQTITLAVERTTKVKYLGLCHGVMHTVSKMAELIGEDESQINYTIGGANHFEIITRFERDGEDLLDKVAQACEDKQRKEGHSNEMITAELYRLFDGYPCNEDIHTMEFLPYYIHKGTHLEQYEQTHNFVEKRIEGREARWEEIREYLRDERTLEAVLPTNTERLEEIIDAVCFNRPLNMYVNVTNRGYVSNLPNTMCVEVPVVIHRSGYQGVCVGELPKAVAALTALHGAVQDLTVDAALNGDRHAALQALSLDPMCYTLSMAERAALLDELLAHIKNYIHPGLTG